MARLTLVAGGTGFIGSHIVNELWKKGHPVRVLTRNPADARKRLKDIDVEYLKGDVLEPASLSKAMDGVSTVVTSVQFPNHPVENPSKGYTYEKYDAQGTENLVAAAKAAGGVTQFIYLSGAGVRSDRPEPWFRAKFRAETAVINSDISYTIFRPSWVYGREDRSLNRFVRFARYLPAVPLIGNGRNRVQPLFILDLADAVVRAIGNPAARRMVFEIGGPQTLTMNEVAETILDVLGRRKPILHQPVWLMKAIASPLSLLPKPLLSPSAIDFIMMDEVVDNSDVVSALKLDLTRLADGLSTYVARG
jgi:NADH dehydrogenase